MNTLDKLKSEIEVCELHASRLRLALKHIKSILPLTPEKLEALKDEDFGFLELMSSRFAKLQDTMGGKIFPLILKAFEDYEESDSFIDRLNRLEKLGVLEDVNFWKSMRKVRNEIAHEYPNPDQMFLKINGCFGASHDLLTYWEKLKQIIAQRILQG